MRCDRMTLHAARIILRCSRLATSASLAPGPSRFSMSRASSAAGGYLQDAAPNMRAECCELHEKCDKVYTTLFGQSAMGGNSLYLLGFPSE